MKHTRSTQTASASFQPIAPVGRDYCALAGSQATKMPEVDEELSHLGNSIDGLEKVAHQFVERLQPILRASVQAGSNGEKSGAESPMKSRVGADLEAHRNRILHISAMMEAYMDRLAV